MAGRLVRRAYRYRFEVPGVQKRGKTTDSATYFRNCFTFRDGGLTLAKQDEPLASVWSRPLPQGAGPSQVTVSRNSRNQYFVSILVETTVHDGPEMRWTVGVDAGITSLVALSTARAHGRISARRRGFLHKLSTRLVHENQVICIEGLSVRNMVRNHSLTRAISEASWSELRRQLEYKAEWYGRQVIAVDRCYPSFKTCSVCGEIVEKLPLNVREWTCRCGAIHDRDVNAARMILAAALAVAASGDGVRPART